MSARKQLVQVAAKVSMLFGAILVVTVLLAAMPGHHAPVVQEAAPQQATAAPAQQSMPGMDMEDEKASEKTAVADMTPGHHEAHNLHMFMTSMRPEKPGDVERANEIVAQLRAGIEKYKDYHVALDDGFKIFGPNVPQPEYHFTNYRNGFLEAFTFDPARPTSLLYKKTATGYELVGAMYTMPKRATEDQLDARIPLSIAMWHLHTNLCFPALGQLRNADWTKFGLHGSIATEDACSAAGGRFHPVVFGWMVHVYPYRQGLDNIFAMHHMD
ncbi:MAG: hypothetical protein WBG02_18615 [Candidatus Acidiferrum sp.]